MYENLSMGGWTILFDDWTSLKYICLKPIRITSLSFAFSDLSVFNDGYPFSIWLFFIILAGRL